MSEMGYAINSKHVADAHELWSNSRTEQAGLPRNDGSRILMSAAFFFYLCCSACLLWSVHPAEHSQVSEAI